MTQRVAWCLFSTTLGTGSTLAWPPSRPGGRAGRCGRLDTWAWALALGHLVLDFYYTLECLGTWAFGLGFSFISRLFGHGYLHLHLGFYHILGCIGLWERDERSSQPCSLSYSWMYRPLREEWKVQSTLLSGYRGLNFLSLIVFSWVHVLATKSVNLTLLVPFFGLLEYYHVSGDIFTSSGVSKHATRNGCKKN